MTETNMYQRGETWFLRAEIGGKKYRESSTQRTFGTLDERATQNSR